MDERAAHEEIEAELEPHRARNPGLWRLFHVLCFENCWIEDLYLQQKTDFLCKLDASNGGIVASIWLVWGLRLRNELSKHCMLCSLGCWLCALLPALLCHVLRMQAFYNRHRTAMVVLIRMAFFLLAGTVSSCAVTTSLPDNDVALVLGRLVLSSRAFTLLASALGFQLPLRLHLLLHTLVVGRIMTLTPAKCASPYFQHPDVRQVLRRKI